MDLASLRIFKAVAEHGGVNRAASILHRVPSNVTTRVKQLEEELGTQLFARERKRLVLSAEGKVLLDYANELLRLSAEAEAALRDGAPRGTLRIGSLESTAATRLPSLLSRYHQLHPEVRVDSAVESPEQGLRRIWIELRRLGLISAEVAGAQPAVSGVDGAGRT